MFQYSIVDRALEKYQDEKKKTLEAVVRRRYMKQSFLKISQNSGENTCNEVFFSNIAGQELKKDVITDVSL